jgi:cyclopropane-fatty-acyl-phospholipid synthase
MQYSCGYWKKANNLENAQIDKMELICKKLKLNDEKLFEILDIGCGWGGLANYMTSKYNVKVTCITISEEQYNFIKNNYKNKIDNKIINPILCDYREINNYIDNKFDRIISVGMMEHVGYKNYTKYLNITSDLLKNEGLMLIHTIGTNKSLTRVSDGFIDKYIFPNGMLPSYTQICKSAEKNKLILQDWHNFGLY